MISRYCFVGALFITVLVLLGLATQSQAEVVFSDNLNNQAEVRRNWTFIGSVDFRSGQAAESGQAIGIGPNSYFYRYFRQSETPDSMQLTFWFRVGRNNFSWSPNRPVSLLLVLVWLGRI